MLDFVIAFPASGEIIFFFQFVHIVYYIDRNLDVEPSLCLWNKGYLIMVYDLFDVLVGLVCKDFVKYFCINIHERDLSVTFLF